MTSGEGSDFLRIMHIYIPLIILHEKKNHKKITMFRFEKNYYEPMKDIRWVAR